MTGGEAYKQKLLTDDALDAAISAYRRRTRRSRPGRGRQGQHRRRRAVLAHAYAVEVLAREGVTGPQRRNAVKTAVLLATVG